MKDALFSKRMLIILPIVVAAGLAFEVLGGLSEGGGHVPEHWGRTSRSRSADGHRALVEWLGDMSVETEFRTRKSKGFAEGIRLFLEPELDALRADTSTLQYDLRSSDESILVLPKRVSTQDPDRPDWIVDSRPLPVASVDRFVKTIDRRWDIARPEPIPDAAWTGRLAGMKPYLKDPQLLVDESGEVEVVLGIEGGVLVGKKRWIGGGVLTIVADPDLFENHGLARGDNAAIVFSLFERLRESDEVVTIDETIHPLIRTPSVWEEIFKPPLLYGTIQAVFLLAAAIWSGLGRFGRPTALPDALARGKIGLIDNIANLLRLGGHSAWILGRYFDDALRRTARDFNVEDRGDPTALAAPLARIAASRGVTIDILELETRVRAATQAGRRAARVVPLARLVRRWRKEMTSATR